MSLQCYALRTLAKVRILETQMLPFGCIFELFCQRPKRRRDNEAGSPVIYDVSACVLVAEPCLVACNPVSGKPTFVICLPILVCTVEHRGGVPASKGKVRVDAVPRSLEDSAIRSDSAQSLATEYRYGVFHIRQSSGVIGETKYRSYNA